MEVAAGIVLLLLAIVLALTTLFLLSLSDGLTFAFALFFGLASIVSGFVGYVLVFDITDNTNSPRTVGDVFAPADETSPTGSMRDELLAAWPELPTIAIILGVVVLVAGFFIAVWKEPRGDGPGVPSWYSKRPATDDSASS